MSRQRLDWVAFFARVSHPHGVRIRLPGIGIGAPEARRTERRLTRHIRASLPGVVFAIRQSFASEPVVIDCVLGDAGAADRLADDIGALAATPPLGWASNRELVADALAARRIWKMGSTFVLPRVGSAEDRTDHGERG